MKIIIHVLIFLFIGINISAQNFNIRVDRDNIAHNASIINKVLIDTFGEDRIEKWLETDTKIAFSWVIDSIGFVKSVTQRPPFKDRLTDKEIAKILEYIKNNRILLPYCIEDEFSQGFERHQSFVKESYSVKKYLNVYTIFPGQGYLWETIIYNNTKTSKLQLLKNSITKYITPSSREIIINKGIKTCLENNSTDKYKVSWIYYDCFFLDAYDELSAMIDERLPFDSIRVMKIINEAYSCNIFNNNVSNNPFKDCKGLTDSIISDKGKAAFFLDILRKAYILKYGDDDFFSIMCKERLSSCNANIPLL